MKRGGSIVYPSSMSSNTSRFKKSVRKYLSKFKKSKLDTTDKKIFPKDDLFNDNRIFINRRLLKELEKVKEIVPDHYKGGLRSLRRKTRSLRRSSRPQKKHRRRKNKKYS